MNEDTSQELRSARNVEKLLGKPFEVGDRCVYLVGRYRNPVRGTICEAEGANALVRVRWDDLSLDTVHPSEDLRYLLEEP